MHEEQKSQGLSEESIGKENEPPEMQAFTPVKNCPEETKSVFSEHKINSQMTPFAQKATRTPSDKKNPERSPGVSAAKSACLMSVSSTSSQGDYGTAELAEIAMGTDARIDDPELLTTKKHLMLKGQNPLSLINALSSKWKRGGRLIDLNTCHEFKSAG
jgi:hypothetical protein